LSLHDAAALGAELLVVPRPVVTWLAVRIEVGDLAHGLVRANAAATTMDFVVGSNGVNHREDLGLTGFPGVNHYTHIFILVKSTNELEARVYDDTEALVYSSTTTIVSSTFGTDFDRNMFNGRPDGASSNGRKQTVKDAGWWQKTLSVAEMEAVVAANPN
jgi:hypothetical protein